MFAPRFFTPIYFAPRYFPPDSPDGFFAKKTSGPPWWVRDIILESKNKTKLKEALTRLLLLID